MERGNEGETFEKKVGRALFKDDGNIDEKVLEDLGTIEVQRWVQREKDLLDLSESDWAELKKNNPSRCNCSLRLAVDAHHSDSSNCVIYGEGGWNRLVIRPGGFIQYIPGADIAPADQEKAKVLGFWPY